MTKYIIANRTTKSDGHQRVETPPETPRGPLPKSAPIEPWIGFIENVSAAAVEVEPVALADHQHRMEALIGEGREQAGDGTRLRQQAVAELRRYKEHCEGEISRLRTELGKTCMQLESTMKTAETSGSDAQDAMEDHRQRVDHLRRSPSFDEVRTGLSSLADELSTTSATMQRQNRLLVEQLAAEIQSLRRQLEHVEQNPRIKGTLAHREAFEEQVRAWIGRDIRFAIIIIRVSNWRQLMERLSRTGAHRLTDKIVARAQASLGAECYAGRWFDGYVGALVPFDRRSSVDRFDEIKRAVGGTYTLTEDDAGGKFTVQVRIWFIEHSIGQTAEHLLWRVDQLIRSFDQR